MKRLLLSFAVLALAQSARSQVVQLSAGSSTLYDASGGGATLFLRNSVSSIGVGLVDGHLRFGASTEFKWREDDVVIGDHQFGFSAGGSGMFVPVRGVFVEKKTIKSTLSVFVGAAGQSYSAPFFNAYSAQHIGAGVVFERQLLRGFSSTSAAIVDGSMRTAFESLGWANATRSLKMYGAGGLLQNVRLANGQVSWTPIRALSLVGTQSMYTFGSAHAKVTSANAGYLYRGMSLSGGVFHSLGYMGETAGGDVRFWRLDLRSDYFKSSASHSVNSSIGERISRRFIVRQFIQGRHVTFGGSWSSNLARVDVSYDTFFYPLTTGGSPFGRALTINVHLQLPHSLSANVSTITTAGKTLYGVYGQSYSQLPNAGPIAAVGNLGVPAGVGTMIGQTRSRGGKYVVRGVVVGPNGPQEGAAILVGDQLVYSNSAGEFQARFRNTKPVKVEVLPQEFIVPGDDWITVQCPETAIPTLADETQEALHIEISKESERTRSEL